MHGRIGIVVPAYNEEALIAETLKNMPPEADRIYVVDDGSSDNTGNILRNWQDSRLCIIRHNHNQGVGASIISGYKKALQDNMDIVVVMAGDNQMDPAYLPDLLKPIIEDKADYAKGNRLYCFKHRNGMNSWRFFGNWMLTLLTKIASGYWQICDPQNGYTAITSETLTRIDLDSIYPRYGYCNDLLVKLNVAGCRVADVIIPARYGREKSKIAYSRYIATLSPLLLRSFFWRLMMKYLAKVWRSESERMLD